MAGPSIFVSGTTHQLLQLGQALQATAQPASQKRKLSEAGHSRPQRQPSEEPSPLTSPAGPTSSTKSKGGGSSISLLAMIEGGVLQPGRNNTTVTYKGVTHTATLQSNGTILFRGTEFTTPSAFSVHVKRLTTPNKQGDDGWHSVHINGTMLHTLRLQYQQQQQQQQASTGGAAPGLRRQPSSQALLQKQPNPQQQQQPQQQQAKPAKQVLKLHVKLKPFTGQAKAGTGAAAGAAADQQQQQQQPQQQPQQQQPQQQAGAKRKPAAGPPQGRPGMHWMQCNRCEVWRSVPDASWPQVSADNAGGGPWFCEDAAWELTQVEPFTPACLSDLWAGGD